MLIRYLFLINCFVVCLFSGCVLIWYFLTRKNKKKKYLRSELHVRSISSCGAYSIERSLRALFEPSKVYLSIIIPAYNEELQIASMLLQLVKFLDEIKREDFSYEIILVDDASTDSTCATATSVSFKNGYTIRTIQLTPNQGKGHALRVGSIASFGKFLAFIDGDGSYDVKYLTALLEMVEAGVPIVIGSRAKLKKKRSVFTFLARAFQISLLGNSVKDTQSGFKMMSRTAARCIFSSQRLKGWAFDMELLLIARVLRLRVVEIPVEFKSGTKVVKFPFVATCRMIKDFLYLKMMYSIGIWRPSMTAVEAGRERYKSS
eukprot:GHVL01031205.1.p1 GENE.GHVL01031205.1~~GHVL01031205.1.p1  ORF type:complete len:318 (-),score=39.66 GHVL01031205.1:87-1040(-)